MQWDRYSVWERININCLFNWRITVALYSDRTLKSPMYTDVRTSQCNGKTKAFISNLLLPLKKKQVLSLFVFKNISLRDVQDIPEYRCKICYRISDCTVLLRRRNERTNNCFRFLLRLLEFVFSNMRP